VPRLFIVTAKPGRTPPLLIWSRLVGHTLFVDAVMHQAELRRKNRRKCLLVARYRKFSTKGRVDPAADVPQPGGLSSMGAFQRAQEPSRLVSASLAGVAVRVLWDTQFSYVIHARHEWDLRDQWLIFAVSAVLIVEGLTKCAITSIFFLSASRNSSPSHTLGQI
jgi:hypothetical protein